MKSIIILIVFAVSLSGYAEGKLKINDDFPDFKLKLLGQGADVTLKNLKGQVVFIDFWASWCEPCKKELPVLSRLSDQYGKKGIKIIGVNVDDDESSGVKFADESKIKLQLLYDKDKILAGRCKLTAMPSSFVIDKKGKIRFIHLGFSEADAIEIEKEIKSLI